MKKLISLSVIVLTAAVMFGQDTTSTSSKTSQAGTGMDSIPPGRHGDTSALGREKWADSSKNRNWQDSSNKAANNNSSDTSGTGGSANSNTDSSTSTTKVEDNVVMVNDKVYVVRS